MSTFQCSLRTDPAPLRRKGVGPAFLHKLASAGAFLVGFWRNGVRGALRRISPAFAGNVGASGAFALAREGIRMSTFQCSLRTDPAPLGGGWASRDRSCVRRERWGQWGVRAGARGDQDVDVPVLTPDRSRSASAVVVVLGSVLAARNGKARPWRFEPEQKVDGSTAQQFRAGLLRQVPGRSRMSAARNFVRDKAECRVDQRPEAV